MQPIIHLHKHTSSRFELLALFKFKMRKGRFYIFFKSWCLKCPLIWIKWVAILRSRSTYFWMIWPYYIQSSKAHITLLFDKRHKHLFCDTVLFSDVLKILTFIIKVGIFEQLTVIEVSLLQSWKSNLRSDRNSTGNLLPLGPL